MGISESSAVNLCPMEPATVLEFQESTVKSVYMPSLEKKLFVRCMMFKLLRNELHICLCLYTQWSNTDGYVFSWSGMLMSVLLQNILGWGERQKMSPQFHQLVICQVGKVKSKQAEGQNQFSLTSLWNCSGFCLVGWLFCLCVCICKIFQCLSATFAFQFPCPLSLYASSAMHHHLTFDPPISTFWLGKQYVH